VVVYVVLVVVVTVGPWTTLVRMEVTVNVLLGVTVVVVVGPCKVVVGAAPIKQPHADEYCEAAQTDA